LETDHHGDRPSVTYAQLVEAAREQLSSQPGS
jgi:hypothetical protein